MGNHVAGHERVVPTKDVNAEALLWKDVAATFIGIFMKSMCNVPKLFYAGHCRSGFCNYWLARTGGYQGQDGKFSTAVHEFVLASVVFFAVHGPDIPELGIIAGFLPATVTSFFYLCHR